MPIQPDDLPENLREMGRRLYRRGFTIDHNPDTTPTWTLNYPVPPPPPPRVQPATSSPLKNPNIGASHQSPVSRPSAPPVARHERFANESQLNYGMLTALRQAEIDDHTLVPYAQYKGTWANTTYGPAGKSGYATMKASGCGPTTLAIAMQYIINNSPERRDILPSETAQYAVTHGLHKGSGTDGEAMMAGIPQQWPGFAGRVVPLREAESLLRQGELIILGCHRCSGYSRSHGKPAGDPDKYYGGHYMVLTGLDPPSGGRQLFWVHDPGGNSESGMYRIERAELSEHSTLYYVYRAATAATSTTTSQPGAGSTAATQPTP